MTGVFSGGDASAELHNLFTNLTVQAPDPLTTWKDAGKNSFPLGSDGQYTNQGQDPLWLTKRSTAHYQFALIAPSTSGAARYRTRDFLQTLEIYNEATGNLTSKLADPPLISYRFDIPVGLSVTAHKDMMTPLPAIAPELGLIKALKSVPVEIRDNVFATGVDTTSRTAATSDIGYQPYHWIMAPAGQSAVNGQDCNNAMQFVMPLSPDMRLKISCPSATPAPAIISPRQNREPTVAWHGMGNSTGDQTPIFKVGTEESAVDLPIRVKVMKNRKVKVKVHLVNQQRPDHQTGASYPVEVEPSMVPTKAELENYLNPLFAYQINTWFDVTIAPAPLVVDFSNGISINPDSLTTDQNLITSAIPGALSDYHINIFILGKLGTINGSYGSTSPSQATCWILGKPIDNYLTKKDLLETVGHEIGHVFFDLGHPNATTNYKGKAPLLGTDHSKRLMCDGIIFNSNSRLIVKAEWDAAEDWLKREENRLTMEP